MPLEGFIYILTNEAVPGYVKIGKTSSSIEQRMRELDGTSVPLPFECFYAARVADCNEAERLLHDAFLDCRVRPRREFFRISAERIASALRLAAIEDATPREEIFEDRDAEIAVSKARARRGRFNFRMVGIKPGAVLRHVRDEAVTCYVVDNRQVNFEGKVMSLSQAALKAIHNMGYRWSSICGPEYWEFEGRTLDEIRRELEEGEE